MSDVGEAVTTISVTGLVAVLIAFVAIQLLDGSGATGGLATPLGKQTLGRTVGAIVVLVGVGVPSAGLTIGFLYGRA
jgi:hypothetical protein